MTQAINWNDVALNGELFERIAACLLQRENPRAVRVTPSQGDGGVDIHVIDSVAQTVGVYQCKYFPKNVSWTKVRASLQTLEKSDWKWLSLEVVSWNLVLPRQLTTGQRKTFNDSVRSVPFPCEVYGSDRLDNLAMDHPQVGDYYLGDGKGRLKELARDWENVAGLIADEQPPTVAGVEDRLRSLKAALDKADPHFRHGYAVRDHPLTTTETQQPGIVMAREHHRDGVFVSETLTEAYRDSSRDAEDRVEIQLRLSADGHAQLEQLLRFGGEQLTLSGSQIVEIEVPGLSTTFEQASHLLTIRPEIDSTPERIQVRFDGGPPFFFHRIGLTRGTGGATSSWASSGTMVTCQIVVDLSTQELQVSFDVVDVAAGRPVADYAEDLLLLQSFAESETVEVGLIAGSSWSTAQPSRPLLDYESSCLLESLLVIQEHTGKRILLPESLTGREADNTIALALLLRGHSHESQLTGFEMTSSEIPEEWPQLLGDSEHQHELVLNFSPREEFVVCGQEITLRTSIGIVRVYRSLRLADSSVDCDGAIKLRWSPGTIDLVVDVPASSIEEAEIVAAVAIARAATNVPPLAELMARLRSPVVG